MWLFQRAWCCCYKMWARPTWHWVSTSVRRPCSCSLTYPPIITTLVGYCVRWDGRTLRWLSIVRYDTIIYQIVFNFKIYGGWIVLLPPRLNYYNLSHYKHPNMPTLTIQFCPPPPKFIFIFPCMVLNGTANKVETQSYFNYFPTLNSIYCHRFSLWL